MDGLTEELGIYAATVARIVASQPPESPDRAARVADSARALAIRMGHLSGTEPVPGVNALLMAIEFLETAVCGLCVLEAHRPSCALGRARCWVGFSPARGKPLPLAA